MRRLLYLTALSMLVVAMSANVALGQTRGPSGADGSYNCDDFDTQPQAQAYYDVQGGISGGDPDGLDRDRDGQACEDSLPAGGNGGGTPSQQAPVCPGNEVNVLTPEGDYICVPPDIEDQTPTEIDAVVNDPRPNAETPIAENQGVPQEGDLTPAQSEASGNDVDCVQFATRAEAQATYNADPSDPNSLDADGDGIACEVTTLSAGVIEFEDGTVIGNGNDTPSAQQADPANTSTGAQYADDDEVTNLPDTGGLPLGGLTAIGGFALIAGGLLLRHRLS